MRSWQLLGLILALCFAAPVLADAPFGSLGGIVGGGSGGNGILPLHGWCLDDDGIRAVDIYVDGALVGRAAFGRRRPDVERAFPGYPDSANAGFAFQLDTTRFLNGLHQVEPQCISKTGERFFAQGRRLEFTNTVENLVPFGLIDFPNRNAQVFGNCNAADPARRYSVVQGWALDIGLETGDAGIGYVELLIDGAIYANSRRDCDFIDEAGGLSNCYGLERPDVERNYPGVLDAPNSGFRFVLDIGALIDVAGFARGRHTLTARAGDIIGQVANISEIPVVFLCDDDINNEGSFGRIGRPTNGSSHAGGMTVLGWALDWEGVREVEISVDGTRVGTASYGGFRGGVSKIYPGFPNSKAPGFGFILDTTGFANGRHQLQVHVHDNAVPSVRTLIGERTFTVSN